MKLYKLQSILENVNLKDFIEISYQLIKNLFGLTIPIILYIIVKKFNYIFSIIKHKLYIFNS